LPVTEGGGKVSFLTTPNNACHSYRNLYNRVMVKRKDKFDISEACGWLGMVLIHAATLPTSLGVILGYSDKLPPLSMVLLVWSGLFLFLIRALARSDKLYIISNAVGFFFNSILLALIVFK
jgi:hypothetical protein